MRRIKRPAVPAIATLAGFLALGLAGTALAFHSGGVAHCDGCHSMHQIGENAITGSPNEKLLKGSDPSSTCLNCHRTTSPDVSPSRYYVASPDGSALTPGGDFFWLTQSYTNTVRGNPTESHARRPTHVPSGK